MKITNGIALILILTASSMMWAESTSAQSIPKPSTPEFSVQITDRSYDIPTTYSIDTYTGKTITHEGYRVTNKTIDLNIKNQQVSQYSDGTGNATSLYYYVRAKGHYGNETDWKYYPELRTCPASTTEYTTLTFITGYPLDKGMTIYAPTDSQIDIQVQAWAGYYFEQWVSMHLAYNPYNPLTVNGYMDMVFHGQKSYWSSIRTLSMADATVSVSASTEPTPNPTVAPIKQTTAPTALPTAKVLPTETPTEASSQSNAQTNVSPGIAWKDIALASAFIVIAVLAVALLLLWRKRA